MKNKYNAGKAWSNYNKHNYPSEVQCRLTYTCWWCNTENLTKKQCNLHHILPREMARNEKEWYMPKYMVILCKQCHKDIHKRMYHYKEVKLLSFENKIAMSGKEYCKCNIDGQEIMYWNWIPDEILTPCTIEAVITHGTMRRFKNEKTEYDIDNYDNEKKMWELPAGNWNEV